MIEISSTCKLGKSLSVKSEKVGDDGERVIAHLKFAEMFVGRDVIDDLCRRPIGWAQSTLFDDQGAPLALLELGLPANEWTVQGALAGPGGKPRLALVGATLAGVVVALTQLGGLVSGSLSWETRGDEVEDVADLLGKEVSIDITLGDGGQQDLFKAAKAFKDSVAASGGGSIKFSDGKTIDIPPATAATIVRELGTITKAAEVCILMERGFVLVQYGDSSYRLDRMSDGLVIERHECWLTAAKGAIKRGLEGIGDPDDEFGRWRWKAAA